MIVRILNRKENEIVNSKATVHRWDDLEIDQPMALIDRRRVIGEHVMLSHVTLHKGFMVPPHQHANEQMAVVLSGRVRFTLLAHSGESRERTVELGPGEVLHLPPNVPHGAEALEETVILDVFSPPSETTGVDAHSA